MIYHFLIKQFLRSHFEIKGLEFFTILVFAVRYVIYTYNSLYTPRHVIE